MAMVVCGTKCRGYFIITTLILLGGSLAVTSTSSPSVNTCPELGGRETFLLRNCSFMLSEVVCTVAFTATSTYNGTETLTGNRVFFKLTFSFRISNATAGSSSRNSCGVVGNRTAGPCLILEKAKLEVLKNLDSAKDKVSPFQVHVSVIYFSLAMHEASLEATFNSSGPIAEIIPDQDCFNNNKSDCSCNVRMIKQDGIPNAETVLESDNFWMPLRHLVTVKLQGRIDRVRLVLEGGASLSTFLINLHGFGIEELIMVRADWQTYQRNHLPSMPELRILNISSNNIESIDGDAFESTPNLESLILSKNKLKDLPERISDLKLKSLDLSHNQNLRVDSSVQKFKHMTSLKWLNMSRVPISSMEVLKPLVPTNNTNATDVMGIKLEGLMLEKCGINIVQEDISFFDNMSSLLELDLSRNGMQILAPNMFRSLTRLQRLKLAANGFTVEFNLEVGEVIPLQYLDLSRNKLKNIGDVHLRGTVEDLNLAGNALSEWNDERVFFKTEDSNNTWVKRLNLSRNGITFVSEKMAQSLEVLEAVDLGGNPFNCDACQIPTFQSWLLQTKETRVLNMGSDRNLTCTSVARGRQEIITIVFNNTACLPPPEDSLVNYLAVIWIPLLVVVSLVLLGIIGMYGYRFEIAYVRHLINIRRQRHIRENESISNYRYDAFVSYSVADRDWVVRELQPHLEDGAEKYRLCLHERDFALGSIIADNIVECMKNSRSTLVILSPHFVKSQWCRWELEVANHKLFEDDREFLILVELKKLDKKALPQHLAYLLDTRTFLEWPEGHGPHPTAWKRLKHALGDSLYQKRMKAQENGEVIELTNDYDMD